MSALDYLRIGRAQTAAVEGAGFPLAAWLGGAPLWVLPVFALLGVIAHLAGFGMNSVTDLPYDRHDPSKAGHPLVAGRVTVGNGLRFVLACVVLGMALFFALVAVGPSRGAAGVLPVLSWLGYVFLGATYNTVGKRWKPGAVLEISGAFALAFLAAGTAWSGVATPAVAAVAVYAFLFTAFQIAVAGELKEIGQAGESNLLRRLGSRVVPAGPAALSPTLASLFTSARSSETATVTSSAPDWLVTGHGAFYLGLGLSAAKASAIGLVAWAVSGLDAGVVAGVGALVVFLVYSLMLQIEGPYDRPRRLKIMGVGEAMSYLVLVFALVEAMPAWLVAGFLLLPVLWFVAWNRVLWSGSGSVWAPGV